MFSTRTGNPKGVTLVELMVVIAVLSIVLGLVYSIFISQMQTSVWRGQLADRQQNLKGAMNIMIGDLLKADGLVNATDPVASRFMCVNAIAMTQGSETITYVKSPPTGTGVLMRESSVTGKTAVLAENITGLSFECFDRSGNGMLNVNGTSSREVRRISITLSGETAKPRPGTTTKPENTITSSVELRNVPQTAGHGCGMLYFELNPRKAIFCDTPGQSPETRPQISIKLCDLEGRVVGGDVRIFPKEPQPVNIEGIFGTTVVLDADNISVMTMPTNTDKKCNDPTVTWGTAIINASGAAMDAGTGLEMVSVWRPTGCTYDISTSRSLSVEAGKPYKFKEGSLVAYPGVLNACETDAHAVVNATVMDNCGHALAGKVVQFKVYDAPPPGGSDRTGEPEWGDMSETTEKSGGIYSAVYNAGSVPRDVDIVAYSPSIEVYNATNSVISETMLLTPGAPYRLVGITPVDNSVTVENCINNTSKVTFEVQDVCGNLVTDDQNSKLSSSTTDLWALTYGGGMQGIDNEPGSRYSTIYNTATTHCGDAAERYINVYHSDMGDAGADLTVDLHLAKCSYPGVTLNVTPTDLYSGCPDVSTEVTAQILVANAAGQCEPAADPADITFEVKSVGASGVLLQDYGGTGPRNGRFLDELGNIGLATRTKAATVGTAITNLIAYDARPGDKLYVRAKADIQPYGNAEYSKEYANPILIVNSASTGQFYTSASYDTPASFYEVPLWYPSYVNGTVYAEIRDCDENEDINAVEFVNATATSDAWWGSIDTLDNIILTESSANSGVFRGTFEITQNWQAENLTTYPGSFITGFYDDEDDPSDTTSGKVPVTGCSQIRATDAAGNDKWEIIADAYPYDAAYPDGEAAFHLIVNSPVFADNGIINTVTARVCSHDPLTFDVTDTHVVTLREDASDNGLLRIDSPLTHARDYIYVGEDPAIGPTPGGDAAVGLRVAPSVWGVFIEAGYPDVGASCDFWSDPYFMNHGCSIGLQAQVCTRDLALGGSHTSVLGWPCMSRSRGSGDYYAKYYDFTLSSETTVKVDVESPGLGTNAFDTYVYILNSSGEVVAQDDDSGPCFLCSRIIDKLPPGDYTIEVTSLSAWTWGDFTVSLNQFTMPIPIQLQVYGKGKNWTGASVVDTIAAGTTALHRSACGFPHNAKYYEFTLLGDRAVDISMMNGAPVNDAYLILLDSDYNLIASNDDCNGTLNANIDCLLGVSSPITLPAGTYIIEATTFWCPDDGTFTLSVN